MKKLILCRKCDRAIHQVLLSSRFGFSMFATLATLCEDSGISEPDYCYASRVIQPNCLLRKSEDDSGTGLHVLDLIDRGSLKPDRYLYNQLLRRCTEAGKLREARIVHAHISKSLFGGDVAIGNTIVNMYVKCGSLDDAREVFDEMPVKDVVSWTMLITGYSQSSRPEEALALLPQMLRQGLEPNQYALSSLIKASSSGRELHSHCLKRGYDGDPHVGSSLVDTYARLGSMDAARSVFDGLAEATNEAPWNSLIAAHARRAEVGPALGLFWRMRGEGILPSPRTYSSLCTAFAGAGCLEQGRWAHAHAVKLGGGGLVARSLLEMYARSGGVEDAGKIFDRMRSRRRDLGCWNSLLDGYARRGLGKEAAAKFREMLRFGIRPDESTFLSLLTACSHSGLLDQGQRFFKLMKMKYGIEPGIRHYAAMVDLLGRAGLVERAERFIREMPVEPTAAVWGALLRACRMHRRTEIAARAAERVFALDPQDRGPHAFLYEMYASAGRWDEASRARRMMESEKKELAAAACSWVEVGNLVHVFVASDESHPRMEEIHGVLERLSGYVSETSRVHLFVGRRGEETDLQGRSEKLALAFALLNAPPGSNIQVKKKS